MNGGADLKGGGAVLGDQQFGFGERSDGQGKTSCLKGASRHGWSAAHIAGDKDATRGQAQMARRAKQKIRTRSGIETQAVQGQFPSKRASEASGVADVLAREPGGNGVLASRHGSYDIAINSVRHVAGKEDTRAIIHGGPAAKDGVGAGANGVERVRGNAVGGALSAGGQVETDGAVLRIHSAGDGIQIEDDFLARSRIEADNAVPTAV